MTWNMLGTITGQATVTVTACFTASSPDRPGAPGGALRRLVPLRGRFRATLLMQRARSFPARLG